MKVSLTRNEMLERRRLAGGFEHLRTDCSVEDTAGVDVDALLEGQLRERYLALLDSGDRAMLAPEDVAPATVISTYPDGGSLLVPPETCRRVLSVRLAGWEADAEVLPPVETSRVRALQANPYTAADASAPVAVALPGGRVAAWPGAVSAERVEAAVDVGPHIYNIDERAVGVLCASEYNIAL